MTRADKERLPGGSLEPALAFLRELWALDHALGSTSKRMHDRMGITGQQRMVLRFVGKHPKISAVELAVILHVEKSTLSLALKRLEERGLVVRHADPADARRTFIVLTARGKRFDHPAVGTVEGAVARALKATAPRDMVAVRTFLQRLVRLLQVGERAAGEQVAIRPPTVRSRARVP